MATVMIKIAKDENFKTVGIVAYIHSATKETIYSWGGCCEGFHYIKNTTASAEQIVTIFRLVELKAKLQKLQNYVSDWFDTARANASKHVLDWCDKHEEGIIFQKQTEEKEQLEKEIQRLIDTL